MQIPLPIQLAKQATFSNFYPGQNKQLIQQLQMPIAPNLALYLWGKVGVGCSHLLQACCHAAYNQGLATIYLSFRYLKDFTPVILEQLEELELICLDNIDNIAGLTNWEEALFHLYNRIQQKQARLVIAAHQPPAGLGLQLPDLGSRLSACAIYQVMPLNDSGKLKALQLHAKSRGLQLSLKVGNFLLNHQPRDMQRLLDLLEKIDKTAWIEQKPITIPFVKKVLASQCE